MVPRSKDQSMLDGTKLLVRRNNSNANMNSPSTISKIDASDDPFYADYYDDEDDDVETEGTVRFALHMDVFDILCRDEYTDEELAACFYSQDDISDMNAVQTEIADRMEQGKRAKKSSPYRGLEAWTEQGQLDMNERIYACVDAVLDEQSLQWADGISSRKRIAKVAKRMSQESVRKALKLAKQDEKEAKRTYKKALEEFEDEVASAAGEEDDDRNDDSVGSLDDSSRRDLLARQLSSSFRLSIQESPLMSPRKKRSKSSKSKSTTSTPIASSPPLTPASPKSSQSKKTKTKSSSSSSSKTSCSSSAKPPKSPLNKSSRKSSKKHQRTPTQKEKPPPAAALTPPQEQQSGFWSLGSPSLFQNHKKYKTPPRQQTTLVV
eukprot:scaffold6708_cov134-Cylindrotheca_fusiformis.AAC.37